MDNKEKHNAILNFLLGFGVHLNYAKVIAGAALGAALAFFALSQSSCTINKIGESGDINTSNVFNVNMIGGGK